MYIAFPQTQKKPTFIPAKATPRPHKNEIETSSVAARGAGRGTEDTMRRDATPRYQIHNHLLIALRAFICEFFFEKFLPFPLLIVTDFKKSRGIGLF